MSKSTSLLIIDTQVNMFSEERSIFEGGKILNTIKYLLTQARALRLPIIYVQNNGGEGDPDIPGTPGWQIHPSIKPEKEDVIIQKYTTDSFHETNLQNELEMRQVKKLVITGMQTEMCIDATCRRAHELGYDVILVKDAHSTFDDNEVTASQIIEKYNESLSSVVKVEKAISITF